MGGASIALALVACSGGSPEGALSSAKSSIEKNDRKAAVIQLKNVLQQNPSQAEARYLLGKLLVESGDFVGGAVELGKATELGFALDQVAPLMARSLLGQQQYAKVIAQYASVDLKTADAKADVLTSLATAYAATQKMREAADAVTAALQAKPGHLEAQILNARLLAAEQGVDAGVQAINKVLSTAPESATAWQVKGDFLMAQSATRDGALAAYQESVKRDKKNLAAHAALIAGLLAKKDMSAAEAQLKEMLSVAPDHPQVAYCAALLALEKGDLKTAHERIQAVLKSAPDNTKALHLAGSIELRRGALLQAESHLSKALSAAPELAGVRLLLAQTHLRSGDATKALSTLQPLLSLKSPQPEALSLAAVAYQMQGDAARAESLFAQATQLNPNDTKSRTALALAHVAKGRAEQGFDELRSISAGDVGITADLALINAHMRKRDFDAALKAAEALEKKPVGKLLAINLRGRIELARGNRELARQAFDSALKLDPTFFPAVASLAGMDMQDKKPDQARARFEQVLAVNPAHLQAQLSVIALKVQAGASKEEISEALQKMVKSNPGEQAAHLALIRFEMGRENFKQARTYMQEAAAVLPESDELLDVQGQVQFASGDFNQAASTYARLATLRPNSPFPHVRLAEISINREDKLAAEQSLKKALAIKPDLLLAQGMLIGVDLAGGKVADARNVAKNVQRQRPSESAGYALEGDVEQNQKNWQAAAAAYRIALTKKPSTEVAMKLHGVLTVSGKTAEADAFEAQWRKQSPSDIGFVMYLGDRALTANNFSLAERHYADILKSQPSNPLALNNMAWLTNRAGNKKEALALAQKANELQPKQPNFMDTLAEIHAAQGNLTKAIEVQKEALQLAPERALHRLHLAKYYAAAGQKSEARDELRRLADLGDKFPAQAEVKKMMAAL